TAAGIGLPDLDQRFRYRLPVLVEHLPMHDDALAERLALALLGQVVVVFLDGVVAIDRAGQFGQRVRHHDQGLRRRAFHRRAVSRRQMLGKRAQAFLRIDERHSSFPYETRSIANDTPCPTPTHIVASASLPPLSSRPCAAVSARRAPDMPSGWPSAIAPPC